MEKRRLGASDLFLSVIGMGCWQFGGGRYWGAQAQEDVDRVVHRALEAGINFFDTAEAYNDGASEISLGLALKGRRSDALIGSKIAPSNMRPATLREHCEQSLGRLQTDYIDLYMVHWPITSQAIAHFTNDAELIARPPDIREAFDTLQSLQREGKIRHIGISNHGIGQMKEVQALGGSFVANELAYNLLSRAIEQSLLPYCTEQQIGVIAYMPLQQGLLSGKYRTMDGIKPLQARSRHFHHTRGEGTRHGEEGAEAEIVQALGELGQIADELGTSIGVLSLAWIIANGGICSTIAGSRNLQQLEANLHGAYTPLDPQTVARLNRITEPVLHKLGANPDYYENSARSRIR